MIYYFFPLWYEQYVQHFFMCMCMWMCVWWRWLHAYLFYLVLYFFNASHVTASEDLFVSFHQPKVCNMWKLFKSCIKALYYVKQTITRTIMQGSQQTETKIEEVSAVCVQDIKMLNINVLYKKCYWWDFVLNNNCLVDFWGCMHWTSKLVLQSKLVQNKLMTLSKKQHWIFCTS